LRVGGDALTYRRGAPSAGCGYDPYSPQRGAAANAA